MVELFADDKHAVLQVFHSSSELIKDALTELNEVFTSLILLNLLHCDQFNFIRTLKQKQKNFHCLLQMTSITSVAKLN